MWATPTGNPVTIGLRARGVLLASRRFLFRPPLVFFPLFLVAMALFAAVTGYLTWETAAVVAVAWLFASPLAVAIQVWRPSSEMLWHPNPVGSAAGGVMCLVRWRRRRGAWELDMLAAQHPGHGAGTWLMTWMCAQADTHGRTLTLHARTKNLIDYYRAFQFESHDRRPRRMTRRANPDRKPEAPVS